MPDAASTVSCRAALPGLDGQNVLVNNAGIQIARPSHELSSADFDKVLAVLYPDFRDTWSGQ